MCHAEVQSINCSWAVFWFKISRSVEYTVYIADSLGFQGPLHCLCAVFCRAMSTKPRMFFTESRGDVDLDPFQLDALRPLLLEQEMRIKNHFDHRMEQLMRLLDHSDHSQRAAEKAPRASTFQNVGGPSPDDQLGLRAGVAPHLLQLIDRVKANNENIFNPQASFVSAFSLWDTGKWRKALEQSLGLYEYAVDLLVVIYAFCLGVEIHHTSISRSEPSWAVTLELAFCVIFSVDLLIRICMERRRFFTGGPRQCH